MANTGNERVDSQEATSDNKLEVLERAGDDGTEGGMRVPPPAQSAFSERSIYWPGGAATAGQCVA